MLNDNHGALAGRKLGMARCALAKAPPMPGQRRVYLHRKYQPVWRGYTFKCN